jgi:putative ABC transport system permease protein
VLLLAFRNLTRRPFRNGLTIAGLAAATTVLACLEGFEGGYRKALGAELERMGVQLMLVPLGCPYDAAARVLKGGVLENSLPEAALAEARRDPAVAVAAPLLMAALPRSAQGRADMWVGLDESALALKPWWRVSAGQKWFPESDSVILGCDAAELELRAPGDSFFSPETGARLRVAGVLERSGTTDDSLFFVPLRTAQRMFGQEGRLTAVAIRLKDPQLSREAAERLQRIPGAQVVTLTEMMGVFLNLVGAARTLLLSIGLIAIVVSALSVFNTLLAGVVERTNELAVLRAIGASPAQLVGMITTEAVLLTSVGSGVGLALSLVVGSGIEHLVKELLPLAPRESLMSLSPALLLQALGIGLGVGVLGGLYPAWRASRLEPAAASRGE